jgi:hypothetical protein
MDLQPGENETFSKRANYSAGKRAVGGRLYVTDRRLVFEAHGFDKALGGKSVDVPLRDVTAVSVEPKGSFVKNLTSGGIRDRLRAEAGGTAHLFVVSPVAEVVEQVRRAASL